MSSCVDFFRFFCRYVSLRLIQFPTACCMFFVVVCFVFCRGLLLLCLLLLLLFFVLFFLSSYPSVMFINCVLYILFNLWNLNWNILCHHFARSVCKSAEVPCTNKQTNHSGVNLIWILRHCGLVAGTCEYKGQNYYQGQQWQDGCDYQCTCTDSKTGHYECHEL